MHETRSRLKGGPMTQRLDAHSCHKSRDFSSEGAGVSTQAKVNHLHRRVVSWQPTALVVRDGQYKHIFTQTYEAAIKPLKRSPGWSRRLTQIGYE